MVEPDADIIAQFQQHETICKGEAAKTLAGVAPIHTTVTSAGATEAGMLEGRRDAAQRQVIVKCMTDGASA